MLDLVQRVLTWILTWEVVGVLSALLIKLGIPPIAAPIVVVLVAMAVIYKIQTDRYALQRWRRRYYQWRRR